MNIIQPSLWLASNHLEPLLAMVSVDDGFQNMMAAFIVNKQYTHSSYKYQNNTTLSLLDIGTNISVVWFGLETEVVYQVSLEILIGFRQSN